MNALLADPTMQVFAVCAAILVLKMWLTGTATGLTRILRGAYITDEDYELVGKTEPRTDPLVERLRRVHQNDLENILPFLAVGFLYALTGPSETIAWWLFTLFTAARIAHTGTYLLSLQPWRSIIFEIGNVILLIVTILLLLAVW